ncbi:Collagen Alpha-5(Vi) Chain [Manis pentadactyla]|nr:Collagen Alpha-5(Vi) Chain [Manis pentadactyla]
MPPHPFASGKQPAPVPGQPRRAQGTRGLQGASKCPLPPKPLTPDPRRAQVGPPVSSGLRKRKRQRCPQGRERRLKKPIYS